VGPLRALGVPLLDLHQDATKYFDVHHTANDTIDQVTKEDLDQVVGAVATVAYLAADAETMFTRVPEEKRKRH
jgi:Zn-dependent M28 family amino/carboxypeptidase